MVSEATDFCAGDIGREVFGHGLEQMTVDISCATTDEYANSRLQFPSNDNLMLKSLKKTKEPEVVEATNGEILRR